MIGFEVPPPPGAVDAFEPVESEFEGVVSFAAQTATIEWDRSLLDQPP